MLSGSNWIDWKPLALEMFHNDYFSVCSNPWILVYIFSYSPGTSFSEELQAIEMPCSWILFPVMYKEKDAVNKN